MSERDIAFIGTIPTKEQKKKENPPCFHSIHSTRLKPVKRFGNSFMLKLNQKYDCKTILRLEGNLHSWRNHPSQVAILRRAP